MFNMFMSSSVTYFRNVYLQTGDVVSSKLPSNVNWRLKTIFPKEIRRKHL